MTSPQAMVDHVVANDAITEKHLLTPVTATLHEIPRDRESPETIDHVYNDVPQESTDPSAIVGGSNNSPGIGLLDETMGLQPLHPAQNFDAGYARIPTDPQNLEPMPNHLGLPFQMGNANMGTFLDSNNNLHPFMQEFVDIYNTNPVPRQSFGAFARLEFEDGTMLMNTLSVILGRDTRAQKATQRRHERLARRREQKLEVKEPQTPLQKRHEKKYEQSIVSESGGIMRNGDDSGEDGRQRKQKARKASKISKSTGSVSQLISRRNSLIQDGEQQQAEIRCNSPGTETVAPVDPATLRPSPYDCPLIGIHPPAPVDPSEEPLKGYKAISRQHVKIAYNGRKNIWEATILGRNGAFINEVFHYYDDVVPLTSGTRLQIGGVEVKFVLPDDNPHEEDGVESDGASATAGHPNLHGRGGGKEMSFDFEDPSEDAPINDTSDEDEEPDIPTGDEPSENDGADASNKRDFGNEDSDDALSDDQRVMIVQDDSDDEDSDDDENDDENDDPVEDQAEDQAEDQDEEDSAEHELPEPNTKASKKRRPGRPPKNGVMSKREQKEAKKAAQNKAKKTIPEKPTALKGKTPAKSKVGRPRKDSQEEAPPIKTEKRKYTKRKPKEPGSPTAAATEGGSDEESKPPKEKKEKKSVKPPRSPSPTFNEEDLTPEQMAKPSANYVTLIHEALSNSPEGSMGLSQIYRAIQRKYPWFVLKTTTNGWQSSVRHNLSQHDAFRKVDRDGKGWKWAIVEGVSIEKEKKQRHMSPPPSGHGQFPQPIYQGGPMHGPGMMGPPGPYPPPAAYYGQGAPPNPYPYPPPQNHGLYGGHAAQPQLVPPQNGSYSSPYAPKPPVSQHPLPHQQARPPPGASPSFAPQHQPIPALQPPQKPLSKQAINAIDIFRANLINGLKLKTDQAEVIVESGINRVLGRSHTPVFNNPFENGIMDALRALLSKIPGWAQQSVAHNRPSQPTPIMRPSFMGQGPSKPNSNSRPPTMPLGTSMSPATPASIPNSASPPANGISSTSTPQATNTPPMPNMNHQQSPPQPNTTQLAGSKRPLEDPEDRPNPKRVSVPLPQKDSAASMTAKLESISKSNEANGVQNTLVPVKQEASLGDSEHYKGLSTTGPPPLKT